MNVSAALGTPPLSARLASLPLASRFRVPPIASTGAIVGLSLLAFAAVRATGGTPNALGHLAYGPIVLAAFLFGWRGGLASGLLMGALLGPAGAATGMPTEGLQGWLVRFAFFMAVGGVTGGLFDYVRAVAERWQATATEVVEREQEGMLALARGAEAKDTDTGEHIRRVQLTSEALARAAGLTALEAAQVGWAAMLHDVGKLHVPDSILLKPGPLSAEEWVIMRQHPIWGEEILADGEGFELARHIARWHHENIDGTGYPDGLAGERIPLEARIVRVADAFDAITNRRPYAGARTFEEGLAELVRCRGRMFDPELVELMVTLMRDPAIVQRIVALRARPFFGDGPADG
jgi:HD domain